jgi:hypothetical protein
MKLPEEQMPLDHAIDPFCTEMNRLPFCCLYARLFIAGVFMLGRCEFPAVGRNPDNPSSFRRQISL